MAVVFVSSFIIHLTMVVIFIVIANLSKIMGKALKKKPHYKAYYISSGLMVVGQVIYIAGFESITFFFDLAALFLASLVTYYYWSWLPKDLLKG